MFAFRGRSGPSRSTPANVQCQKCLKRGHYSYECKASTQERPYVSRPSRSQQLRNPKLMPKLTSDTSNTLEKKKGVADEEIAKQEAERARKRELEEREDEILRSAPKRRRSVSSDSVSTISTNASADSRQRSITRSPSPRRRGPSPGAVSDVDERDYHRGNSRSLSPHHTRRRQRSFSRDSRSPPPQPRERTYRDRDLSPSRGVQTEQSPRRRRRYSSASRASGDPDVGRRDMSRSPGFSDGRPGGDRRREPRRDHNENFRPRGRRGGRGRPQEPPAEPPRERSLSPFSKRLALTQSMNSGGR